MTDRGENRYTAEFGSSPDRIMAAIHVRFDRATLPHAVYTGDERAFLHRGATLRFSDYGEKGLILYRVDRETFEKENPAENRVGEYIDEEHFATLVEDGVAYSGTETDVYFYVVGYNCVRYPVNVRSSDETGGTVSAAGNVSASGAPRGAKLTLTANCKTELCGGTVYETANFAGWFCKGELLSAERELVWTVQDAVNITAVFTPKTKVCITIYSNEAGLTPGQNPGQGDPNGLELRVPGGAHFALEGEKAEGKTVVLGWFTPGETLVVNAKLFADPAATGSPFTRENSWKYILLFWSLNGARIGEGQTVTIPVFGETMELRLGFLRSGNFYTDAKLPGGESAKENYYNSDHGLY